MLESGHSIADYQIVKPLTENQLYSTYQVSGPSFAAAKLLLIDPHQLADKKARQVFLDQAQHLLGQSFPQISPLLAAAADDEACYCIYLFQPGTSLADQLPVALSPRRALEIVKAVATCLAPPHASDLWHGAISPATIYLDGESVALDEFALASLLRLDFHSGVDRCYSSPELVRGEALSSAADLYSLGIVLYRLIAGAVPFSLPDPFATAMLHVQDVPAPLPESLAFLQPLIDGLLCAVPADRWTAEQVISEIDHYLLQSELDRLTLVGVVPDVVSEPVEDEPDRIFQLENLMETSAMADRIERRLKERSEALQSSSELTADAKRASSEGLSAIGQQSYRENKKMYKNQHQQKRGAGKFLILVVLGVAIGGILYLTLFGPQTVPQQAEISMPEPLLAGLEKGSQQLEQGDLTAAEKTFEGLVSNYAFYPQPYNNLAAIYAKQGDLERSRNFLERAMATDDSYVTVYRNLGAVYSEMARDSYGRALQLEKGQQSVTLQVFSRDELLAVNSVDPGAQAPPPVVAVTGPAAVEQVVAVVDSANEAPRDSAKAADVAVAVKPVVVESLAKPVVPAVIAEPIEKPLEPIVEVVLALEPESAENFLRLWAAAWSAQDVDSYLGFYSAEYTPSDGQSREAWAKNRRRRLTTPKQIKVTLEDFSMVRQDGTRMQIEVNQSYQSDRYADKTRKLFYLSHAGNNWQIVRERSLGRVR